MAALDEGHQSCNDTSVKFPPFSSANLFILPSSFFFSFNPKQQPPALKEGVKPPQHASGGVTLCQIIMRLLGEGQSDAFGRTGWMDKERGEVRGWIGAGGWVHVRRMNTSDKKIITRGLCQD